MCPAILRVLCLSMRMHQGLKPFAYTGHPPPMPSTFRLEHSLLLSTMPGSHFRLLTQQMLTLRSLTHSHSLKRPLIPRGVRQARQFLDSCTRLQALRTFRLEHSLLLSIMPGSHFRLLTQQMLTLRSLTHSHSLKRPLIPRGVRQARQFLDSCTRLQALQQSCQPLQSQDLFHEVPQGKQKMKAF